MDKEGRGLVHIESFFRDGLIRSPADIFRLKGRRDELIGRERWAETSVDNLIAAIDARREVTLDRFLFALGIRHVGQVTARDLARRYGSYEALRETVDRALATREEMRSEEHTSELQSLMRISYAVFCLKKNKKRSRKNTQQEQSENEEQNIS